MERADLARIAGTLEDFPFPKRLAVEVCSDCNLACTVCHHPAMRRPKGLMPFALWQKCADEVAAVSPTTECWFSFIGEPLLEPELLLKMLAYGASVGLRSLKLNTNGMLLTPDLAEPILDSPLDLVVFGIDGHSSETYERIRVGGLGDRLFANVEHLLSLRHARGSGPEIQVQFIEMDENLHERDAFVAYWLERGAVVKVRRQLSWGGQFGTSVAVPAEERIPCPWALTMMHVFWDGRVPRCCGDTEGEEGSGNAWQDSLTYLWAQLGVFRRKHLSYRFGELPDRCQTCRDWMTGAADRIRSTAEHLAG